MAVPLLQLPLIYKGESDLWSRYFIMYVVCGFLGLAYLMSTARRKMVVVYSTLAIALMVGGNIMTAYYETNPVWGKGVSQIFTAAFHGKTLAADKNSTDGFTLGQEKTERAIASYVNSHPG